MATNRQAVLTYVRQEPPTNFIDINRTVALTSDTATFAETYRLYTKLEEVLVDFGSTTPEYLMAQSYFGQTGGSGYLYIVPVRDLDVADPDVITTLTTLENDPSLVWSMVIADDTIAASAQVIDGSLAASKYNQAYHMVFETADVNTITSATTDPASVNKAVYDALTGDNSTIVGNMSFVYVENATDYVASEIAGAMMGQDIGSRTAKFIKPLYYDEVTLTGGELTFLMSKNCNVFTGTNERVGRSFIKEGVALKEGSFIDTSLGAIWMEVNITSTCYDLFESKKVSIDETGFALLANAVEPIFKQAQNFGIIQAGKTAYTMTFEAGTGREIIGRYTYNEAVAGHFVTNYVDIR